MTESMPSISCVLPLRKYDFDRFKLLRRTIEKYFQMDASVFVVVPDDESLAAESVLGSSTTFHVVPETSILPELKTSGAIGWWKQQAIKLAFSSFCDTDFYLTLDSDCIAVRPLSYDDLIVDGRGIIQYESLECHKDWYIAASLVLQMPLPRQAVGVTPFLMSREIAQQLCQHLASISPRPWDMFLGKPEGCTEYTLYHLYGLRVDLWEKFHRTSTMKMFGNCIWKQTQAASWDAADSFESPDFFFSVIQSNADITPNWTWERIRPYIEAD